MAILSGRRCVNRAMTTRLSECRNGKMPSPPQRLDACLPRMPRAASVRDPIKRRTIFRVRSTAISKRFRRCHPPPEGGTTVQDVVGDSKQCQKASALLLEDRAIYIQPINYPTVPKGAERLRITRSPFHTDSQTDYLVEALVNVWDRLGLWR